MDTQPQTPAGPGIKLGPSDRSEGLPSINGEESFAGLTRKLSFYFCEAITEPSTFEQLRSTAIGHKLHPFVTYLSNNSHHPALIAALLTLKWHFSALDPDDRGVNETRGYACEIVAWRFLAHLSQRDAIDNLLYELSDTAVAGSERGDIETGDTNGQHASGSTTDEDEPLLGRGTRSSAATSHFGTYLVEDGQEDTREEDPTAGFIGLNALEIAAVADAKKFLSQKSVQRVINGIWNGDIIFWAHLGVHTKKKAQIYNKRLSDPYCRMRVPKYQKAFEVLFFASFLALYYGVLGERDPYKITVVEVLLFVWIAAFAYDELSEFIDAGSLFYATDFWSLWDLGIIGVGAAFLITRVIGLTQQDDRITDIAFDILSLEALFLVPRICSVLSLHPYFGTLIPCLKEMTKDFIKFLGIVVILYLGFLTTFTLLARDHFTLEQMSWLLIKVFFGSSYLGFDAMREISPILGPPLMLIFVCLTNILLITSLISLLSNSLTKVIEHAREEYLFVSAVYVLEASTSNRLTYFYPPLNLVPLILLRPLRLVLSSDQSRSARIALLKATHFPFLGAIWLYENGREQLSKRFRSSRYATLGPLASSKRPALGKNHSLRLPHAGAASFGLAATDNTVLDRLHQPGTPRPQLSPLDPIPKVQVPGMADVLDHERELDGEVDDAAEQGPDGVGVTELKTMVAQLGLQVEILTATLLERRKE